MRLGVRILRFLFPEQEHNRMLLRRALSENQAHAEELSRVLQNGAGDTLAEFAKQCQKRGWPADEN